MSVGIVVGATGGIGAACARAIGASVNPILLVGRRRRALDELAVEIGDGAAVLVADIAENSGRDAVARAVEAPIAWMVIASGIALRRALVDATAAEIETTFSVNLVAPALLLRRMLELEWSYDARLVFVGSISATRALPNRSVYGASKAGVEHLARSLAPELAARGIRVNVVAPGVIETPFLDGGAAALVTWVAERVPERRIGQPAEVASVVRYLVTEAPPYVTGARIAVDGGVEASA